MDDYIFSNDLSKNIDAMIYTCGYETCQPGHSYGPAVRSGYLIHYILSGKGIFRCEGTTYHLSAGDAFLIRPHTLIYYQADARQPWTYTWIGMQGIKVEEYFHRTSLMNVPCVHCGQHEESIRLCHEKMFKAYRLTRHRDLMMNSILYEYLYLWATRFPNTDIPSREKHISYVEEALKYIEANYSEAVTIQDLANWLGLERTYLYRLFKSMVGMSPQAYLLDVRIRQACTLLTHSDLTITNIARSVGYEDSLYFSRLFHRKKGQTPSQYRLTHQSPESNA